MENRANRDNVFIRILKYLIPWKGDKPTEIIRKIIFLCALIVLITTLVIFLNSREESRHNMEINSNLSELFHGTEVQIDTSNSGGTDPEKLEMLENFKNLKENDPKINFDDVRGWLTIDGYGDEKPLVDNLVMQSYDNDYYLHRNIHGESVRSGSLFLDFRCDVKDGKNPGNIVVYGHNMLDAPGEIDYFGVLLKYFNYSKWNSDKTDITFYKQHPTITYSSLYDTSTYKIFGAMLVNTDIAGGEVFKYHNVLSFANKEAFDNYCAEILDRSSFINPDVDLKYGDELITLSTCIYGYGNTADTRFVVFGRKTRDGESPEVDVEKAFANPSPKFYDEYDRIFGYKWKGRQWSEDIIWGFGDE